MILDENIFANVVRAFEVARDKHGSALAMDSLMVTQGDTTYRHYFRSERGMNDLRSLSKPTLGLAMGIAMARGLWIRGEPVGLDTFVWPLFEHRVKLSNDKNREKLARVRLRHLLNHTTGFDIGLMFSKDIVGKDPAGLLEYVFNTSIEHEPGTYFAYSNAGPYIFSALIQEELGVNLAVWVEDLLFKPLGITFYEWANYGRYCAASSGLKLAHEDLHKIALVFSNKGVHDGRRLVSESWLDLMSSSQVETPSMYDRSRVFPKFAYGYFLWICEDGRYYCDGTEGQYLIVLPASNITITTFGHQADMRPITECLKLLL